MKMFSVPPRKYVEQLDSVATMSSKPEQMLVHIPVKTIQSVEGTLVVSASVVLQVLMQSYAQLYSVIHVYLCWFTVFS